MHTEFEIHMRGDATKVGELAEYELADLEIQIQVNVNNEYFCLKDLRKGENNKVIKSKKH